MGDFERPVGSISEGTLNITSPDAAEAPSPSSVDGLPDSPRPDKFTAAPEHGITINPEASKAAPTLAAGEGPKFEAILMKQAFTTTMSGEHLTFLHDNPEMYANVPGDNMAISLEAVERSCQEFSALAGDPAGQKAFLDTLESGDTASKTAAHQLISNLLAQKGRLNLAPDPEPEPEKAPELERPEPADFGGERPLLGNELGSFMGALKDDIDTIEALRDSDVTVPGFTDIDVEAFHKNAMNFAALSHNPAKQIAYLEELRLGDVSQVAAHNFITETLEQFHEKRDEPVEV